MPSLQELEERYASMDPDEFINLNRANLTEVAQAAYDKEAARRAAPGWLAMHAQTAEPSPQVDMVAEQRVLPKTSQRAFVPALAWGALMMFASVVSFILLMHAMFAFSLGAKFRYDHFFGFVDKFLLSGVSLVLSSTAGIFSFFFVLGTRRSGTWWPSFFVSVAMWAAIGVWFVVTQPQALKDNPPFLVVGFLGLVVGFGYPLMLLVIMKVIGGWLGLEVGFLSAGPGKPIDGEGQNKMGGFPS